MAILSLLLALAAAQVPAEPPPTPDVVVRAVRGRCQIVYAGSPLDGRALQRLADGWPEGRPLLVAEPRGAKRKCLTRIALKLSEQGFNLIQFVDLPTQ